VDARPLLHLVENVAQFALVFIGERPGLQERHAADISNLPTNFSALGGKFSPFPEQPTASDALGYLQCNERSQDEPLVLHRITLPDDWNETLLPVGFQPH
jgi:hypothetical protein